MEPAATEPFLDLIVRRLVCAVLATVLLAMMLRFSFLWGRLSVYPRFDDVTYLADGLGRWQTLRDSGLSAALKEYVRNPPHSPYSDLLAATAFAIFGPHDWAPYVANWPLLFLIFYFGERTTRGVPPWQRICCLVFLATIPLVNLAAYDFRPDYAASVLTAAGIMALLATPSTGRRLWHKAAGGALFGLAILFKPPFVPATLTFFFVALVFSFWQDRFTDTQPRASRPGVKGLLAGLLLGILVPLPHYLVGWRQVVAYISENQLGAHRAVWAMRGTRSEHLTYYLTGGAGRVMLGYHMYMLLGIVAVCAAAELLKPGRLRTFLAAVPFCAMLLVTWLLPTLNPHKQPYFALTFHILLVFVALRLLSRRLQDAAGKGWAVAVAVLMIAGIACFRWPSRSDHSVAARDERKRIVNGVYQTVLDHAGAVVTPRGGLPPARANVLLTGTGDLNTWLLQYMARKQGMPINFFSPGDTNDPRPFIQSFDHADFVLAADQESGMYSEYILSSKIQDQLLAQLRKRPEFRQIASFTAPEHPDRSVYLFEKTR